MPFLFQPVSGFSPLNTGRLNLHVPKHVSTLPRTPARLYGTNENVNTNDGEWEVVKEGALFEDSFVAQNFEDDLFDLSIRNGLINTKDGVHTNEDNMMVGNRVLGPKNVLIYDTSLRGKKKCYMYYSLSYRSRQYTRILHMHHA